MCGFVNQGYFYFRRAVLTEYAVTVRKVLSQKMVDWMMLFLAASVEFLVFSFFFYKLILKYLEAMYIIYREVNNYESTIIS